MVIRKFAAKIASRRRRNLLDLPQGPGPDAGACKGFFCHFLDIGTCRRVWGCAVHLDWALLFAGGRACKVPGARTPRLRAVTGAGFCGDVNEGSVNGASSRVNWPARRPEREKSDAWRHPAAACS